jgi:hypothetical protein
MYTAPPAAQPAPVQEPVAWRTFDGEGGYDYRTYDTNEDYADEWQKRNPNHKGWVEPLFTAAQRQPLTDERLLEIMRNVDADTKRLPPGVKAFARGVEEAHDIKENT